MITLLAFRESDVLLQFLLVTFKAFAGPGCYGVHLLLLDLGLTFTKLYAMTMTGSAVNRQHPQQPIERDLD